MLVIVPNSLRAQIYQAIDEQLAEHPDAAPDREIFYETLLSYFNEHGVVPDFSLQRKVSP